MTLEFQKEQVIGFEKDQSIGDYLKSFASRADYNNGQNVFDSLKKEVNFDKPVESFEKYHTAGSSENQLEDLRKDLLDDSIDVLVDEEDPVTAPRRNIPVADTCLDIDLSGKYWVNKKGSEEVVIIELDSAIQKYYFSSNKGLEGVGTARDLVFSADFTFRRKLYGNMELHIVDGGYMLDGPWERSDGIKSKVRLVRITE